VTAVETRVDRRTTMARAILEIVGEALAGSGLRLVLDDDTTDGHGPPNRDPKTATIRVHGPDAVARLLWPPTPDSFAEAYLRGDVDIDGHAMTALMAAERLDLRRLSAADLRRLLRWTFELRPATPPGRRLERVARLSGTRHSRARDMAAVRFHYDVGEAFYSLWLDRRLTYSCAYFDAGADPAAELDAAQEAKLDLVCRKLDLQRGDRLLDIGCGWGSLILYAAERYGVEAVGVTLSQRQADEANRRAAEAKLADRVRAEVRDYRDLEPLGRFDKVASIGMFEHVGEANVPTYFRSAFEALRPGGLFLNHGIAQGAKPVRWGPDLRPTASHFIDRYVFPDGELLAVDRAMTIAHHDTPFELLDVQALRPHYALTLEAWVSRLEANWEAAVAAAGEEVARTWRLYMSAARRGFESGDLDVAQLLFARPGPQGPAERPVRPWWWTPRGE